MDKTDLSLIISALGVLLALQLGVAAIAIIIAFITGLLIGQNRQPPRPRESPRQTQARTRPIQGK